MNYVSCKVILLHALLMSINIFAQQQKVDSNPFKDTFEGVIKVDKAFNMETRIAIDRQINKIQLSGETGEQSQYLGASITFKKPNDLTDKKLALKITGNSGAVFIRLYNDGEKEPCWAFRSYDSISPDKAINVELMENNGTQISWHSDIVNGEKAANVNRIDFIFKSNQDKLNFCRFEDFLLAERYVPEFTRIISEKLTTSDLLSLPNQTTLIEENKAVAKIIVPYERELNDMEAKALSLLNSSYSVDFEQYKLKENQLRLPTDNYILFSDGITGSITNRLTNLLYFGDNSGLAGSYEVHNIMNAFQAGCNILCFAAVSEEAILEAVNNFVNKHKKVQGKLIVKQYCDPQKSRYSDEHIESYCKSVIQEINDVYAGKTIPDKNETTDAIRFVSNVARMYRDTLEQRILPYTFMSLMRIISENYESSRLATGAAPPSFRAHELAFAVDIMDDCPYLSDDDLVLCGNVVRKITEDCMDYWEMKRPMELYETGETEFLTNHPLFASRSVSAMSRFLDKRFSIPAANYWIAVSRHAFASIGEAKYGPEDAAGYQWFCNRIYRNFILDSGHSAQSNDYTRDYIDFAIGHFNQMGKVVSYGDSIPMTVISPIHQLALGYQEYNDSLSAYLINKCRNYSSFVDAIAEKLNLPENVKYEPRMLGLTVFESDDFLKDYYNADTQQPLLNKAVFRSGYEPNDEFIMLGGLNLQYQHGHLDGNAIIEYSHGDRYWLVDGDYIKAFQEHHNSVIVSKDTQVPELGRGTVTNERNFAHIRASALSEDSSRAIFASSIVDYAGMEWTRNIFWTSLNGFWVIDNMLAQEKGNYVVKCVWRTLGELQVNDDYVRITQKGSDDISIPDQMFIIRADQAKTSYYEQFDYGHNGQQGYYYDYKYASPETKAINQTYNKQLDINDELNFVNFFKTTSQNKSFNGKIRKLSDQIWIIKADSYQLVSIGKIDLPLLKVDAEKVLFTENGLLAANSTKVVIDGKRVNITPGENFSCNFDGDNSPVAKEKIQTILQQLWNSSEQITKPKEKAIDAPLFAASQTINTTSPITAAAADQARLVVGLENGSVEGYDNSGTKLWKVDLGAKISALTAVKNQNDTYWAVGTECPDLQSNGGYVGLISNTGKLVWKHIIDYNKRGRPSAVRTITSAKLLEGNTEQIVAGVESWRYYAFDTEGNQLWIFPVLHSATVCAAADMTGDGIDELALGCEYYYHWLVDADGKELKDRVLNSPGDVYATMADTNNDGTKEAIFARNDGFVMSLRAGNKESGHYWRVNVGGVASGIVDLGNARLAIATSNNSVVFLNNGKKEDFIYLPDALLNIAKIKNNLYTCCRDGYAYKIRGKDIVGKFKIPQFENNLLDPKFCEIEGKAALIFGTKISILDD